MPAKHYDSTAHFGLAQRVCAPARQFNEMLAQNVEQVLRYQYEAMGDMLSLGLEQMTAAVTATDPAGFVGRQAAINARLLETSLKRGEDLAQISADVQARLAAWADDAFDPDALRA
jgi:phasin family protein